MKHSILTIISLTSCSLLSCSTEWRQDLTEKDKKVPFEITGFETIRLLDPDLTKTNTLMEALKERRSEREFNEEMLSLQQLSELFWSANGLNRKNDTIRTTAPSARSLYPIEIYAAFRKGIFRYEKKTHSLEPVLAGDYRSYTGIQSFVEKAPLNLLYIADLHKNPDIFTVAIDAGHNSQNVYLYCASEGMKVVTRTSTHGDSLLRILNLDPGRYHFIMAQTVGT